MLTLVHYRDKWLQKDHEDGWEANLCHRWKLLLSSQDFIWNHWWVNEMTPIQLDWPFLCAICSVYVYGKPTALGIWIKNSTLERTCIQDNQKLLKWVLFIFRLFAAAPVQTLFQLACGLSTPSPRLINMASSDRSGSSHTCICV